MLSDELHALETRLLDPQVRRSPGSLRQLLHENFREIGASGQVWDLETVIAKLGDSQPMRVEISEFEAERLSEGMALVTYRAVRFDASGKAVFASRRSSLWLRCGKDWAMRFHQGTPCEI